MLNRNSSGSQAAQLDCVSRMEHNFSTYSRTRLAHVSVPATTRGEPEPRCQVCPGCDFWNFVGNSSQPAFLMPGPRLAPASQYVESVRIAVYTRPRSRSLSCRSVC